MHFLVGNKTFLRFSKLGTWGAAQIYFINKIYCKLTLNLVNLLKVNLGLQSVKNDYNNDCQTVSKLLYPTRFFKNSVAFRE